MNIRVKYIRVSLFVFALLNIAGLAVYSIAQEKSLSSKSIFLDSDQDGLSDDEEKSYGTNPHQADTDGDGYGDGAEVKSGYNPLKPAPGDKLTEAEKTNASFFESREESSDGNAVAAKNNESENQPPVESDGDNITQKMSDELAVLMNSSGADKKSVSIEDLDEIINKTVNSATAPEDLPEIDASEIKVKKQDYSKLSEADKKAKEKEDALGYLTAASYILINNAPQKISSEEDVNSIFQSALLGFGSLSSSSYDLSFYKPFAESAEKSYQELIKIEVPEKYLDFHKKGLQILKEASALQTDLKANASDPVASMTQLAKMQGLINITGEYLIELQGNIVKLGITDIPIQL